MASDCTVAIDNGYINIRVGAIIMKGNKFLMVGNQKDEYCENFRCKGMAY